MEWFSLFIVFAVGAVIGSFLNVVIHRGPALWGLTDDDTRIGNFAFPRSYCPACMAPIDRQFLIPLAGYFLAGRRCTKCNAEIALRYPVVETLGAISPLIAVSIWGWGVPALCVSIMLWLLIALAFIDLETGFLPDALTLTLIFLGFAFNMIDMFAPLPDAIIGAVAGYGAFRIIGAVFQAVRGIEGLGQGDAKLLAGAGSWLGWQMLAPIVLIAALTTLGAVFIVKLRGSDINQYTEIPFGPALCLASALAMIAIGL